MHCSRNSSQTVKLDTWLPWQTLIKYVSSLCYFSPQIFSQTHFSVLFSYDMINFHDMKIYHIIADMFKTDERRQKGDSHPCAFYLASKTEAQIKKLGPCVRCK